MSMPKTLRVMQLENAIARAANVSIEAINGKSRQREVVDARHAIWYIAHDHMGMAYTTLARLYNRDHTTIMSGVKRIRAKEERKSIFVGIQRVCPEILIQHSEDEAREIKNWRF